MDQKHRPGEQIDSSDDDTEGQKFNARGAVPIEDDTEAQRMNRRNAVPTEDDTEGQKFNTRN